LQKQGYLADFSRHHPEEMTTMIKLKEHKIKTMIAQTGYSVRAWAEQNGFPQGTLSGWLTGARNIKRSSLEKLADALHCDIKDIAEFTITYTGLGIDELEADREEICGIFGNLSKVQRKTIIDFSNLVADANRKIEEAEL
jgi:DNA-binding Xre family transcriptional regulator